MATYDTSTGLRALQGGSLVNEVDTGFLALAQDVVALVAAAVAAAEPAGTLKATARAAAPTGFLLCDGAAVSRSGFATLFAAIGTTYGVGDGSTTFNVPDGRGRTLVGADGSAGRLSANDALGNSGGEEKHTLARSELPTHTHGVPVSAINTNSGPADTYVIGERKNAVATLPGSPVSTTNLGTAGSGTTFTAAGSTDQPFNVMQPYLVANWMIKT